jgi:hydrogenase nickel incorporation protein HypB
MCATCGCSPDHSKTQDHHHHAGNVHNSGERTIIDVEKDILYENNMLAQRNRGYFDAKNILCLNLVSSPGSGKTSLL